MQGEPPHENLGVAGAIARTARSMGICKERRAKRCFKVGPVGCADGAEN